jgi:hypothetical protein
MSMRYKGGVISATAPTTSISAASGVWTLPQQLQALAAGNWTGIPLVIGQAYQGGYFAGQISTAGNGVADYNLVIGPKATAQASSQAFKLVRTNDAGAVSVIDGPSNSSSMNDVTHTAAYFCEGLSIGGFSDWYLPAQNELEVCYYNLKPTTNNNNTSSGINANAVPARASNYTTSNPAQTSAADFKGSGTQKFDLNDYWTSTQSASNTAFVQAFYYGTQGSQFKDSTYALRTRAVRRVAV